MAEKYGVTPSKLRQHGVPDTIDDEVLDDRILYWASIIDRYTRQFFELRNQTLEIHGNDSDTLFLPIPLVNKTGLEVYLNESVTPLDVDAIDIGVDATFLIDRYNPNIRLKRDPEFYTRVIQTMKGGQRTYLFSSDYIQKVVGNFGFVESDASTPLPITRALIKLIILDLRAGADLWSGGGTGVPAGTSGSVGPAKKETTDGHSIEWDMSQAAAAAKFADPIDSLIPDREAKAILDMYTSPLIMESTGPF